MLISYCLCPFWAPGWPRSQITKGNQHRTGQLNPSTETKAAKSTHSAPTCMCFFSHNQFHFSLFNYGRMMMYARLIRHEWEMKGRWDLDKWLPLFRQSDRSPSICSNLNDNKILNCFVLAGQFLHDKHSGKVTLSYNLDSHCLLGLVAALG